LEKKIISPPINSENETRKAIVGGIRRCVEGEVGNQRKK
jgi:hypothetical protein